MLYNLLPVSVTVMNEVPYSAIIRRGKILVNNLSHRIDGEIFGEF